MVIFTSVQLKPHTSFKMVNLVFNFVLNILLILMTIMKTEKFDTLFKAKKVILDASPLWSWWVGIESNGRVRIVICFPAHPHSHMLTHYLPSSTLPQATLTSPFDDAVKRAWPHTLTRRWQHNGFKADMQEQWLQTLTDLHTTHTCHTHTHTQCIHNHTVVCLRP